MTGGGREQFDEKTAEDIYKGIYLPDWTGIMPASSGDKYDSLTNTVTMDGIYSHVIFKQLGRFNIDADNDNRPVGQTNILFVEGGKYALMGLRGGTSWANTFH